MNKLFTILLMLVTVNVYSQHPKVEIPGSELRKITSSIVSGQEYELQIHLPGGYKNSNKKYPVVYLMDSQWDFPLLQSLYGQQYYDGFIPEIIIVGITWGGIDPNPDSLRVRDYTPTNDGRQKQGGGADQFLSFMRNELFPFIETNYKADNKNRAIMGCSLGGLIALYALFSQPDMFSGYAAASPGIGWGGGVIYQYEKKYFESHTSLPARLYMTIGGVERSVPGFESFAKFLAGRNYQSLHVSSKVLENTGHSGTKSETFSRGLQYVFERPMLNLDAAVLNKYAGTYQFPNGNKIEIKNENNQLELYFNSNNKYNLYAAGENDFYSVNEFLNIHFTGDELKLERYGSNQILKKIK